MRNQGNYERHGFQVVQYRRLGLDTARSEPPFVETPPFQGIQDVSHLHIEYETFYEELSVERRT
jgi:hypothetical protein